MFEIIRGFDDPAIGRYRQFMAANGVGITGIEFIRDAAGVMYTYDVNTNTNYNGDAESHGPGRFGMRAIATYLGGLSGQLQAHEAASLAAA
jgi:hypothetical protein